MNFSTTILSTDNLMKYLMILLCVVAISMSSLVGITLSEDKEIQNCCTPRPPEHISKVVDAITKGLVTLDERMLEYEHMKKYPRLADSEYELSIGPDHNGDWFMTVTFLPKKPSALMLVRIKKNGEVSISDGL